MKLLLRLKHTWQVPLAMFIKIIRKFLNIYKVKTSHVLYSNID